MILRAQVPGGAAGTPSAGNTGGSTSSAFMIAGSLCDESINFSVFGVGVCMKRFFLVPLFLLAACQTGMKTDSAAAPTSAAPAERSAEDPCGSRAFENLVGTPGE